MRLAMVVEDKMLPIPDTISVEENYGHINVIANDGAVIDGDHMILNGIDQAFIDWLKEYDGVWLGVGPPCAEQFVVKHIK